MAICPADCVTETAPDKDECNLIIDQHIVSRLILGVCNYSPLTLGTTNSYNQVVLPTNTPAAVCAAIVTAKDDGDLFVTPPIVDTEIADPSLTDVKVSCNNTLQIEGTRTITFVSRAAWTTTGVVGATSPVYGNLNFWNSIKKARTFVVFGYITCSGDVYWLFKDGKFAAPTLTVSTGFEAQGDATIRVTKGTVTLPNGFDDMAQPQVNISCDADLNDWGA